MFVVLFGILRSMLRMMFMMLSSNLFIWVNRESWGLNEILYFVSGGGGKSVLRLLRLNEGVVLDLALK